MTPRLLVLYSLALLGVSGCQEPSTAGSPADDAEDDGPACPITLAFAPVTRMTIETSGQGECFKFEGAWEAEGEAWASEDAVESLLEECPGEGDAPPSRQASWGYAQFPNYDEWSTECEGRLEEGLRADRDEDLVDEGFVVRFMDCSSGLNAEFIDNASDCFANTEFELFALDVSFRWVPSTREEWDAFLAGGSVSIIPTGPDGEEYESVKFRPLVQETGLSDGFDTEYDAFVCTGLFSATTLDLDCESPPSLPERERGALTFRAEY